MVCSAYIHGQLQRNEQAFTLFDFCICKFFFMKIVSLHTVKDLCKTINPPPSPGFEYIATWWHKSFSKLKKIVLSLTNKLFQSFMWEGSTPYFSPPKHAPSPWTSPTFLKIPNLPLIWLYYILCNSGSYWMNICRKYYLGSIQNYWNHRRDAICWR